MKIRVNDLKKQEFFYEFLPGQFSDAGYKHPEILVIANWGKSETSKETILRIIWQQDSERWNRGEHRPYAPKLEIDLVCSWAYQKNIKALVDSFVKLASDWRSGYRGAMRVLKRARIPRFVRVGTWKYVPRKYAKVPEDFLTAQELVAVAA
jgi:hypothetical protein